MMMQSQACQFCNQQITFAKRKSNWIPVNRDGSEHWCEKRIEMLRFRFRSGEETQ
jgi:hypothetical protein